MGGFWGRGELCRYRDGGEIVEGFGLPGRCGLWPISIFLYLYSLVSDAATIVTVI